MGLGQWTTDRPVPASQSRAEPSHEWVRTRLPSGWKLSPLTCCACPSSVTTGRRSATSQISAMAARCRGRCPAAAHPGSRPARGPAPAPRAAGSRPSSAGRGPRSRPRSRRLVGDRQLLPVGPQREERRREPDAKRATSRPAATSARTTVPSAQPIAARRESAVNSSRATFPARAKTTRPPRRPAPEGHRAARWPATGHPG